MKGMIFTEFMEMVEQQYGLAVVDRIIDAAALDNDGAFTSVGNYHHEQMLRLVQALSEASDTPTEQLLQAFGKWVFLRLFAAHYGQFFVEPRTVFDFLSGIESYIHVEVRKLYPDAELPTFEIERPAEARLLMVYRSQRPFAHFAHGLIQGCVTHYGEQVDIHMQDLSEGRGTAARFELQRREAAA